ncbi:MAG: hypothetical protein CMH55_05115 [Myxococcales bacterium]|nr:hypothetical protein [Myxococcales bacterium]
MTWLLQYPRSSEKLISGLITVACALLLAPKDMVLLFIVVGQGHFVIAYLYRFKAKKVSRTLLLSYGLAVLVFAGGYWLTQDALLLAAVTSIYFAWHMLSDERHLMGGRATLQGLLEILPALLMLAAYELEHLYAFEGLGFAFALSLALWLARLALAPLRQWRSDGISAYFAGAWLILAGFYLAGRRIPADTLWGAIILYHYLNWYLFYGLRFAGKPERMGPYVRDVLTVNGIMLISFFLWRAGYAPVLDGWFGQNAFYVWTCLHLVFTTRREDLGYLRA